MLQACFRKFLIVQKTSFCRSVMLKKGGIACQAESICRKTSRLPLGAPAAYFPEFVSSELLKQAEFLSNITVAGNGLIQFRSRTG